MKTRPVNRGLTRAKARPLRPPETILEGEPWVLVIGEQVVVVRQATLVLGVMDA